MSRGTYPFRSHSDIVNWNQSPTGNLAGGKTHGLVYKPLVSLAPPTYPTVACIVGPSGSRPRAHASTRRNKKEPAAKGTRMTGSVAQDQKETAFGTGAHATNFGRVSKA